jgi:hypothetical protein
MQEQAEEEALGCRGTNRLVSRHLRWCSRLASASADFDSSVCLSAGSRLTLCHSESRLSAPLISTKSSGVRDRQPPTHGAHRAAAALCDSGVMLVVQRIPFSCVDAVLHRQTTQPPVGPPQSSSRRLQVKLVWFV